MLHRVEFPHDEVFDSKSYPNEYLAPQSTSEERKPGLRRYEPAALFLVHEAFLSHRFLHALFYFLVQKSQCFPFTHLLQLCWSCEITFRACSRVEVLCSFVKEACGKAQRVSRNKEPEQTKPFSYLLLNVFQPPALLFFP